MTLSEAKLSYNPKLMRVRVELLLSNLLDPNFQSQALLERARARLVRLKSEIPNTEIYLVDSIFIDLEQAISKLSSENLKNDRKINITLGQAFLKNDGLTIETLKDSKHLLKLKTTSEFLKHYSVEGQEFDSEMFYWRCLFALKQSKMPSSFNQSHLDSFVQHLREGRPPAEKLISIISETVHQKSYGFTSNKSTGDVAFYISDKSVLSNNELLKKIIQKAEKTVTSIASQVDSSVQFSREQFISQIRTMVNGPEFFGLGIPRYLLITTKSSQNSAKNTSVVNKTPVMEINKNIRFDISEDKKIATISYFQPETYLDPTTSTLAWLLEKMAESGIRTELNQEIGEKLTEVLAAKGDLTGLVVQEAKEAKAPERPTISLADLSKEKKGNSSGAHDIRTHQLSTTAEIGQLIATVKFEILGQVGFDVLGTILDFEVPTNFDFTLGEGVEERNPGQFFCTIGGVPITDGKNIRVDPKLIHNGDVNLKSGNISFSGPVEIKGTIEQGVTVDVGGDLFIHGSVQGGFIRSGGNIEILGGINTGNIALTKSKGDLKAEFIENSRIECGGNLIVKKAILNSQINVAGSVSVDITHGLVAGGMIRCRHHFSTAKLGAARGLKTVVRVGVDYRAENSASIREKRLTKLRRASDDRRLLLRDLQKKKGNHRTDKMALQMIEIPKFLTRIRNILEKLEMHLKNAKNLQTFEKESKIFVHELLTANCEIEVGGTPIAIINDMAGVEISSKRRRGTFVHAIEDDTSPKAS